MKKIILSVSLILLSTVTAQAFDLTGKTGVGVTGGKVFPVGDNAFNDQAEGAWAYGAYVRHQLNPNWGVDAAFTRQDYDKICTCTRSNIVDVMGMYRVKGAEDLTPVVGAGLGLVENKGHEKLHLGVRLRAGMEKAYSEQLTFGLLLDYQNVSKLPGSDSGPIPSDIHTVVPKLEMTWYFGK